jgi:hypothetical protein
MPPVNSGPWHVDAALAVRAAIALTRRANAPALSRGAASERKAATAAAVAGSPVATHQVSNAVQPRPGSRSVSVPGGAHVQARAGAGGSGRLGERGCAAGASWSGRPAPSIALASAGLC